MRTTSLLPVRVLRGAGDCRRLVNATVRLGLDFSNFLQVSDWESCSCARTKIRIQTHSLDSRPGWSRLILRQNN